MPHYVIPGSETWRKERDFRVRFRLLTEAILVEQEKPIKDFDKLTKYHEAREAYRAAIVKVLGESESRAWDAKHNICVSMGALDTAKRYQRRQIQRYIAKFIDERRHRQIWAVIWKSRQPGVSTEVAVQIYLGVARGHGQRALVMAQSDPDCATIFDEKYQFIHEHDPLKPRASKSTTEELVFPDIHGKIRIRSAMGRKSGGRGGNNRYFHGSEVAWFEGNPYILLGGIFQGITHPQSMCFLESTGNGQSGFFYEKVLEAWNAAEAKREGRVLKPEEETEWEPIFLPWYMDDEAKKGRPFESEEDKHNFLTNLRDDEKLIQQEEQLTPEQMNWYRYIYNTKAQGETPDAKRMFMLQEYPARPMEAFQAPGSCAFDSVKLVALTLKAKLPVWRGDIKTPGAKAGMLPLYDYKRKTWIEQTPNPILLKRADGPFSIWKHPKPGHRYAMGVDLAKSGAAKADSTEIYVIDRDEEECVAHFEVKGWDPKHTLEPTRLISKLYNNALINPETNFSSTFVLDLTLTDRVDFLYFRWVTDDSVAKRPTRKYGWRTNKESKRVMVDELREKLEVAPKFFIDRHLLDQAKTFKQVQSDSGEWTYPGAVPGSGTHDDAVDAMGLALLCHRDMPLKGAGPRPDVKEAPPRQSVGDRMKGHLEYEAQQREQHAEGW